jgi:Asp-tRNA(Asn)/Glu-tRNA(Gln) amidotransferase A subunit family amidase
MNIGLVDDLSCFYSRAHFSAVTPYDLSRSPGGSSGGTGAAVAANFGAVGIGTDTVNSVRSPSSANCLVGVKPTLGLVSRTGIIPYSLNQDTAGPMTRCVADAAAVLSVIAGYDSADSATAGGKETVNYHAYLAKDGLRGKRLGVFATSSATTQFILRSMR